MNTSPQSERRLAFPPIQGQNTIYFTLLIPNSSKPENGWPVAIVGHGGNGNKDASVFFYVAELAKHGIATIAINAVCRGREPLGTLSAELKSGETVTFSSGGRGIDQNGDGTITTNEGSTALPPLQLSSETDGNRQSVVDDLAHAEDSAAPRNPHSSLLASASSAIK